MRLVACKQEADFLDRLRFHTGSRCESSWSEDTVEPVGGINAATGIGLSNVCGHGTNVIITRECKVVQELRAPLILRVLGVELWHCYWSTYSRHR